MTRRHGRGTFTSSRQAASDATAGPPDAAKEFDETRWSSRLLAFKRPFVTPSRTGAPELNVVRVPEEAGEPIAIGHRALPEDRHHADVEHAKLPGADVHAPVLCAERLTRDTRGRVVALSERVYRGDRHPAESTLSSGG